MFEVDVLNYPGMYMYDQGVVETMNGKGESLAYD